MKKKLIIFAMHPIPYLSPVFREIYKINKSTIVFFLDTLGFKKHYNPYFKTTLIENKKIISGYENFFLKNLSKKVITGFFSRINFDVFRIIKKKENKYILINGYQTFSSWLILLGSIIFRKKIIFKGETIREKRNIFKTMLIKIFFLKIEFFLYSCSGNLKFYKSLKIPNKKLISFPCCVDYDSFLKYKKKYISQRDQIRKKLGYKKKTKVILFVSKFIRRKNPGEIIKCIKLMNSNDNIELLFVGGGPEEKNMKLECKKNNIKAKFIGFLSQKKLGLVYLISDVYINTSYYDASPKTLNEALCFDIPIISPIKNIGQAKDIILDGKNGYKYQQGNFNDLKKKIRKSFKLNRNILIKTNKLLIKKTHPIVGASNLLNNINL